MDWFELIDDTTPRMVNNTIINTCKGMVNKDFVKITILYFSDFA